MDALWRDLALSIRTLRRSPIFTAAAVLTLALGSTGAFAPFLFDVASRDGLTFAAASIVLAATTTIACAVPAWQAARTDRSIALRAE